MHCKLEWKRSIMELGNFLELYIKYLITRIQAENLNFNGESQDPIREKDDNTSIEILDDMPPSKNIKESSPLLCLQP
ncbi:Uncharacterized protein TCM_040136 [Theobroma cacao]|uniref:Uncharacterized protein n=1 Tax=Theobroma cacao TaxID=3641 RepID=A0A061GR64_THECC|nr:Uncharacterized protein TCM_040136 [Theobroma cacao]